MYSTHKLVIADQHYSAPQASVLQPLAVSQEKETGSNKGAKTFSLLIVSGSS